MIKTNAITEWKLPQRESTLPQSGKHYFRPRPFSFSKYSFCVLETTTDGLYIQECTESHSADLAELPPEYTASRDPGGEDEAGRNGTQGWVAPAHLL